MIRRVLGRVALVIPIAAVISALVFLIARLAPGDPIQNMFGRDMTPEQIAAIRQSYGLDDPLAVQYWRWLTDAVQGDFGSSISLKAPVLDVILPAFANTAILAVSTVVFSVLIGVTVGVVSGIRTGTLSDRVLMVLTEIGNNIPVVWLGLLLIWLFALQLGWLPTSGMYDVREGRSAASLLQHLVLPTITASSTSLLVLARLTRDATVAANDSPYMRTYRALGFPARDRIRFPVLRNIAIPVVSITGLQVGYLLGGVIIVENIFAWPGIGSQLVNAVTGQDYPVVQGAVLAIALAFILVNLVTDIVADLLNTRLRTAVPA